MGYQTDFTGRFTFKKPLTAEQVATLREFCETRHEPETGEPSYYCQWVSQGQTPPLRLPVLRAGSRSISGYSRDCEVGTPVPRRRACTSPLPRNVRHGGESKPFRVDHPRVAEFLALPAYGAF